jgi:GNAT superfamily N-acetyltransferase
MRAEFSIRPADLGDAAAIARVHVASWQSTYPGIVAQEHIDLRSVEDRTRMWVTVLRGETDTVAHVFVGVGSTGQVVGFISGGPIRDPWPPFEGELYAMYLLAAVQRHGLGRKLIRAWAADLLDRGLNSAIVGVLAGNPACQFYERLGARRVRDGTYTLGGHAYPEVWYGWDSITSLTPEAGVRQPPGTRRP